MPDYQIRRLDLAGLQFPLQMAAREGWNPGLHDAASFFAADPQGFLAGVLDGEPIATLSAVNYEGQFGFLGLYIVLPEQRGQGYGKQLWNAALDYLQVPTVGLDGVVEQQPNYKKSGFVLAHRNIRFQTTGAPDLAEDPAVVALAELPFAEIAAFDRRFFPTCRDAFLREWLAQPESAALGIVDGGRLCAYGVMRRCGIGHKIGPLCADSPALAETLFNALRRLAASDAPVYLDVPEPNTEALALANRHAMQKVFETARMYKGPAPDLPLQQIYGITTFELG